MRRSILSFNITQGSDITLRALELLQIVNLFNSRPPEKNLCSNAPPNCPSSVFDGQFFLYKAKSATVTFY